MASNISQRSFECPAEVATMFSFSLHYFFFQCQFLYLLIFTNDFYPFVRIYFEELSEWISLFSFFLPSSWFLVTFSGKMRYNRNHMFMDNNWLSNRIHKFKRKRFLMFFSVFFSIRYVLLANWFETFVADNFHSHMFAHKREYVFHYKHNFSENWNFKQTLKRNTYAREDKKPNKWKKQLY